MLVDIVKTFSRKLLPGGREFRRLPMGPAAGSVMKLNFHCDLRLFLGLYEIETQRWFRRLVKPGYRSFDVGGLGGYDALLLSKLSGGGRVISFECEDLALAEMRDTFDLNPYPIAAVKAFVSDQNTETDMTLDRAAEQFFIPDFIKIDIEGAEARALSGAAKIIAERKPSMIVEVHGQDIENQCTSLLKGYGYSPRIVNRIKIMAENRPTDHNRWLICEGRA